MTDISSREAFRDLKARGEIAHEQELIYKALTLEPDGLTANECFKARNFKVIAALTKANHTRFTELYYLGKVARLPRRVCRATGRTVTVWKALPPPWIPIQKPLTYAELMNRLRVAKLKIQALERRLTVLESENKALRHAPARW